MAYKTVLVEYEDTMIHRKLEEILGKDSPYGKLIGPMICENEKAVNTFFKISAGIPLEEPIPNGNLVKVPIDTLVYNCTFSKEEVLKHNELDDQNAVLCSVKSFNGYHRYSGYTLEFQGPDNETTTANISIKDLTKAIGI